MIKCNECNKEFPRLQWTHFKYKCLGNLTLEQYKEKYPDAPLVDKELSKSQAITEVNLIKKYGETEGLKRWNSYKEKQALTNTFEYKKEKYGWSEDQFKDYNKSRAVTLDNLVSRHGETEGLAKWEAYCERQSYTNTLEYFIERDKSVEVGTKNWLDYNYQKGGSSRIQDVAQKYNISLDEAAMLVASRKRNSTYDSEGERVFLDILESSLGEEIKYSSKTSQYGIWCHTLNQLVKYDIVDTSRKKIIEYHGDYWHMNPLMYEPDHIHNHSGLSAKEVWRKDQEKYNEALRRGFELKVVWESDFIKDKNKIIKETISWLTK